jgi:hypothetical protein
VGGHIILTIAQVHASRGGAGGNQWKSRGAQRPKQTDVRINVAKDQRRFEIFTIRGHRETRLRFWEVVLAHLKPPSWVRLVLSEAKAPQPTSEVHDSALTLAGRHDYPGETTSPGRCCWEGPFGVRFAQARLSPTDPTRFQRTLIGKGKKVPIKDEVVPWPRTSRAISRSASAG